MPPPNPLQTMLDVLNLTGVRVFESPLLEAKPKLKLSPACPVSDEFRAEMDAWLLDRFGVDPEALVAPSLSVLVIGFSLRCKHGYPKDKTEERNDAQTLNRVRDDQYEKAHDAGQYVEAEHQSICALEDSRNITTNVFWGCLDDALGRQLAHLIDAAL